MVQELIPGILCEAMVYVLRGEAWGFPQYYRFPQHQAPPQYLPRKAAQRLLGEELMARSEDSMRVLTKRWLLWARAVCACEVPFLRLDFLLTEEGVWTGELSELGVAVELQGLHPQESRDLVMDAVIGSILVPDGIRAALLSASGCASIEDSLRCGQSVFETEDQGCKYRVNLEDFTLTNLSTGCTASVRPLEAAFGITLACVPDAWRAEFLGTAGMPVDWLNWLMPFKDPSQGGHEGDAGRWNLNTPEAFDSMWFGGIRMHGRCFNRRSFAQAARERCRCSRARALLAMADVAAKRRKCGPVETVVCVSGLPGAMGHEVSQACMRRGMMLAPVGLTGPGMPQSCQVKEGETTVEVTLVGEPGAQKKALEES
ncbi:unnamed protein product [Effrenium voratum]|nr:unnamed protein product [Effrenium voratum]